MGRKFFSTSLHKFKLANMCGRNLVFLKKKEANALLIMTPSEAAKNNVPHVASTT
jgi:hypothetical protein